MAKIVKTNVTQIQLGDDVIPEIANLPHINLESNIDSILSYLLNTTSGFFEYDTVLTTGLVFEYTSGKFNKNGTVSDIAAGNRSLTGNTTNYIELDVNTGAVTHNTSGFSVDNIPLWEVVTDGSSIVSATDRRTLYQYNDSLGISDTASSTQLTITDLLITISPNVQFNGTLSASSGGSLTGTWSDLGIVTTVDINGGTFAGALDGAWSSSNGLEALTTAEVDQLENIGTTTISATQWGYLGAFDQGLATTDSVIFNNITPTGDIHLVDSKRYYVGTGDDASFYFDGINTYIAHENVTLGSFNIEHRYASQSIAIRTANSVGTVLRGLEVGGDTPYVRLYYGGAQKLATTSTGIDVTGNIVVSGTVDGRDIATDGTKLDGIESGATADQTASEILTLLLGVDGTGSGLDSDLLDGVQGANYARTDIAETFGSDVIISGAVTITSGSISGITDLAIADGGTGASTAATARSNLSLYSQAEVDALVQGAVDEALALAIALG